MNRDEYIRRFIMQFCENLPFAPDDDVPTNEAEHWWGEYACHGDLTPEMDADDVTSNLMRMGS